MRLIQNGGEIALATGQAVGKKTNILFSHGNLLVPGLVTNLNLYGIVFTSCALSSKESLHIVNDFSPLLHEQGKISRKGKNDSMARPTLNRPGYVQFTAF